MKKIAYLVVLGALFFNSCENKGNSSNQTIEKEVEIVNQNEVEKSSISEDVDAEQFKTLIAEGDVIIIDVRTADEYSGGKIENAVNIDFYSSDFKQKLESLDKSTSYLVYCAAGGRSGKAKNLMYDLGFTEVYNLLGGYGNWPYK